MVPGFTERECRAAELRRRDLLVQAALARSLTAHTSTPVRRVRRATSGDLATAFAAWIRWLRLAPAAPSGH